MVGVDEVKVDQAIKKGIEFLRTAKSPDFHDGYRNSDVLILWTFIHARVPESDPRFNMLGRDWKKDSFVKAGMNWLTQHYEVQTWNTYFMYALERAGILYGTEKFGEHAWYKEGANALIAAQAGDGSWGKDTDWFNRTWDTCFSVLFLRRAARPLTPTEGGRLK